LIISNQAFNLEFVITESVFGTSLACLGLDVKVDKEQDRKEGSEKNGQVSTELNLQGKRGGRKGLNNRVHSESRSGKSGDRDGSGSLNGGGPSDLGNLVRGEGHGGSYKSEEGDNLEGLHGVIYYSTALVLCENDEKS